MGIKEIKEKMTKLSMSEEEMLKRKYTRPYEKRIADLEKVNAELKRDFKICEKNADTYYDQLTKAKELLKEFVQHYKAKTIYVENMQDLLEQSEQFLKEVEK